ncbi:MAG: hypothetical protein HYW62_00695 [Candidatus Levybacteria bacterium]|nr:hypothetical protein [Candidatus Levybacteria bacterium]
MDNDKIDQLAKILVRKIDKEVFERKYAPVKTILKLVGAGAFLMAAMIMPGLPLALKPFMDEKRKEEYEVWKRFNIPYLKRTLLRLEKQKLVEIADEDSRQVVKITNQGKQKIIKMALDELTVEKPKIWDGKWRLVSFDLPETKAQQRKRFVEYLSVWGFYPLHKSVYLHAYPCFKQVEFLREYMNVGEYVRNFTVSKIENDKLFKDFFGV